MKMYSLSDLRFVSSATLRSWFETGSPNGAGKFAVVDVRDLDFIGGHIKGCLHYQAGNFHETLPQLRKELREKKIDDVVFHCALSQVRGPKSTLMFLRSLDDLDDNDKSFFENLHVWVLKGGFTSWQRKYGNDEAVTEGFIKDLWE